MSNQFCVVVFFSEGTGILHHHFSQPWQLYLVIGLLEAFLPSDLHLELSLRKSGYKMYPVNLSLLYEDHQWLLCLHQHNVYLFTFRAHVYQCKLSGSLSWLHTVLLLDWWVVTFVPDHCTLRPSCFWVVSIATLYTRFYLFTFLHRTMLSLRLTHQF